MKYQHILFDWGNTLMVDDSSQKGSMCDWVAVESIPGAREVLEFLTRSCPCHVATNANDSTQMQIRKALDRVSLGKYISQIFVSREIGHAKPAREFYQHILQTLAVPSKSVLMIGDHLEKDVVGALDCGLDAIWYSRSPQLEQKGIRTIDSLLDLLNI